MTPRPSALPANASPSAGSGLDAPRRDVGEESGGEGIEDNRQNAEHEKSREDAFHIDRTREDLDDLSDALLRAEQLGDGFQTPGPGKRDPDAAEDLRYGAPNENVPDDAPAARAERVGGVLEDGSSVLAARWA